ncbi:hypothetical protein DID78_01450 [Candidatus Marinamargulisbacteria bacterium SCGC AG-343-D04]|nr:hypothetical protein DID78_01450 [Candidatus Marinamargulisbacteria bacterium SCGC AG-343-D04]
MGDTNLDTKRLFELFLRYNKLLGLHITNTFSEDLKFSFGVSEFSGMLQDYKACLSLIPAFSFVGHFGYENRGVLCSLDSRIVSVSGNRCFGGAGLVEDGEKHSLTLSEQFIGKEYVSIVEKFLSRRDCPIAFTRMEYHIDRSHLFFSDEQVFFVDMKCSIQSHDVGSMVFVYPLQFVKQESSRWLEELNTHE